MPLEQPAMRLMVPVGAMVVVVAFRRAGRPRSWKMDREKLGNAPRSAARSSEAATASRATNAITRSARSRASWES